MWSVVKVGPVGPAEPHWSEPIPARIVFDETRTSRLGSPLAGRVTAVNVARGQQVAAGAPVFGVSSPTLAELRSELRKAALVQAHARSTFERIQTLADKGIAPGKEFVTAKESLDEANLAVELAKQKLVSLHVGTEGDATFTVTAPRDGVVVELNLAVGQEIDVSSGTVVAIADLSMVWVVADLFEDDVGALAPGMKAKVLVGAAELEGTIDQVSSIVDRERHTVPIRVKLANPEGELRPNAYAQIRFFDLTPAKVAVLASAVMSDGERSYVYVQEGHGVLKRRDVVVGSTSNGKVPVFKGLELGEQVVIQGAILLDNQIQIDF
jgi:cobalt-zinc-cadmium efflux system membrane fusion protein